MRPKIRFFLKKPKTQKKKIIQFLIKGIKSKPNFIFKPSPKIHKTSDWGLKLIFVGPLK